MSDVRRTCCHIAQLPHVPHKSLVRVENVVALDSRDNVGWHKVQAKAEPLQRDFGRRAKCRAIENQLNVAIVAAPGWDELGMVVS